MASQKPNERQPNSTKRPHTYTMKKRNAKKAQKSAHFNALEKEMKSEIERLKTEKKRLEDDIVALQGCLVSCEETLCGANKRISKKKF